MSSRTAGGESVDGGSAPAASAAFDGQPIGSYLRLQREVRGITVEQLATQTRIPLRSLERLESGSFDGETDGFVRGFVRTVADALGLDPEDTISRMLAEPSLEESGRIDLSGVLSKAAVAVGAVVLLIVAIGLVRSVAVVGDRPSVRPPTDEQVRRRDPVRALAESQSAAGPAYVPPLPVAAAASPPRRAPAKRAPSVAAPTSPPQNAAAVAPPETGAVSQ